jgi:iron complex transport system substrate-binding protein
MRSSLRTALAVVGAAGLLVGTVGCGSSSDDKTTPAAGVTITQANGVTEFPVGSEKRIVAASTAIDNLLALGIKPVAVVQIGQALPTPWEHGKLDGVPVLKVTDQKTAPVEQIASYKPDLYVGDEFSTDATNFKALSGVTKVLGGVTGDGGVTGWKPQLQALGKILGKEQQAQRVIDDDAENVAALAAKYPGLKGKTALVTQYIAGSATFNLVADPKDPANSLFAELGMAVPKAVRENKAFAGGSEGGGRGEVSLELIPTISANFMAIFPNGATAADLAGLPGYNELPQVGSGATVVADRSTIMAMNMPSSLSRAWVLGKIEPQLKLAAERPAVA